MMDAAALARELIAAAEGRRQIDVPPSARDPAFGLDAAYTVGNEIVRLRRADGRTTAGVKVGYANKAVWRALKLETLVWGPMYAETVRYAGSADEPLSLTRMVSPKIEPEIVFRLKAALPDGTADPAAVLGAAVWIALGFEIIDCPFPDWKFQPADFVAAFGLHAALIVGEPRRIDAADIPSLVDELPHFKVRLLRNSELAAEGSGRNSLRSPALCVAELSAAMSRRPGTEPLAAGDLVSSGTLTEGQLISAGERWTAEVDGIELAGLSLTTTA